MQYISKASFNFYISCQGSRFAIRSDFLHLSGLYAEVKILYPHKAIEKLKLRIAQYTGVLMFNKAEIYLRIIYIGSPTVSIFLQFVKCH